MTYAACRLSSHCRSTQRIAVLRTAPFCSARHRKAAQRDRQVAGIRKGASLRTICPTAPSAATLLCAAQRFSTTRAAQPRKTVRSPASSGAGFRAIFSALLRAAPRSVTRCTASQRGSSRHNATFSHHQFPSAAHRAPHHCARQHSAACRITSQRLSAQVNARSFQHDQPLPHRSPIPHHQARHGRRRPLDDRAAVHLA